MNKYVKALKSGKIVYLDIPLPRYYKIENDIIYYSDDLVEWSVSKGDLDMFEGDFEFVIKE